jgi:hypothetical protein
VGPILDMVAISLDVEGASCVELGWCVNSCLLRLFTVPGRGCQFAFSVVTPWGYKADDRYYVQPMSSCMISHHPPSSFPMAEKKKEKEIEKQI